MNVLTLQDVTLAYGARIVLKNINFSLKEGGIAVILGPNGSGKTTLLKAVLGEIHPRRGSVIKPEGLTMGYVSQFDQEGSFWPLAAGEYISLFSRDKKKVRAAMEAVGIEELFNQNLQSLSGGQHRKVQLARALVNTPRLLILDEPTQEMDVASETDYLELLLGLNQQGVSILIVTHLLHVAAAVAREIVVVHDCGVEHCARQDLDSVLSRVYHREFRIHSLEGQWIVQAGGKKND